MGSSLHVAISERGKDNVVIDLNKEAMKYLHTEKRLEIIPEASHLFEEPGKFEEVARLATAWFLTRLETQHADLLLKSERHLC